MNLKIKDNAGNTHSVEFKLGVSDGANGNEIGLTIQRVSNATSVASAFTKLEDLANNSPSRLAILLTSSTR